MKKHISFIFLLLIFCSCKKEIREVKKWHENGKPRIELVYNRGQKDSIYQYYEYYINDSVKDHATYINGKLHGIRISYFENGSKMKEIPYDKGLKHGEYREWHQNEKIRAEGSYYKDEQHGKWFFYDSISGEITVEKFYNHGLLMNFKRKKLKVNS